MKRDRAVSCMASVMGNIENMRELAYEIVHQFQDPDGMEDAGGVLRGEACEALMSELHETMKAMQVVGRCLGTMDEQELAEPDDFGYEPGEDEDEDEDGKLDDELLGEDGEAA